MLPLAVDTGGITNVQVALLIAGGAIIYVVLRWRKNSVTRQNQQNQAADGYTPPNPLTVREVAAEIQALLADLEETSRRLTAQLDNRYTRLEQLLAEADEKIRRLEALTSGNGAAVESTVSPAVPVISDAQRTLARLRQERGAPPPGQDPAYEPIYTLADGGKSPRQIAQELGRQPGEIELILALRPR